MDTNEIDELLEAFIEEDLEKIIKFADIEIIDENVEDFFEKNREKIGKSLMIKIEQGDYDYFYSKIKEEIYKEGCIFLLCFSSKVEDIKGIIEDKEKREELGLDGFYLIDLIKATNDPEYIKGIINDSETREKLGLDGLDGFYLIDLIRATNDPEYIKGIINDSKRREELGLDEINLIDLIKATNDPKYINDFLKSIETNQNTENSNQIVNLPSNMTIGMEIESEGKNSELISATKSKFATGWNCKGDGSLDKGVEVVSPILYGDTEQTSDDIKYVCRRLNALRSNCI